MGSRSKTNADGTTTKAIERTLISMPTMTAYKESDDIEVYVKRLKHWVKAAKIDEEDRVSTLITVIGDRAFSEIDAHLNVNDEKDINENIIYDALLACYGYKKSIWDYRFEFDRIKQESNETIKELISKIKTRGNRCNFADNDERLTSKLIHALSEDKIRSALIETSDLDFKKAVCLALTMESRNNYGRNGSQAEVQAVYGGNDGCWRCGRDNHSAQNCKFINAVCFICEKKGHISNACKSKSRIAKERRQGNLQSPKKSSKVDTGAEVSLMSLSKFKQYFPEMALERCKLIVRGVNRETLNVVGAVQLKIGDKNSELIIVREDISYPLLGIQTIDLLWPEWRKIFNGVKEVNQSTVQRSDSEVDQLKEKFGGEKSRKSKIKNYKVDIVVKENVRPVFKKHYEVPLALKDRVEQELRSLEEDGIISKVEFSDWASPIVAVLKKNGSVRICADFKRTINPVIEDDKYPLPIVQDIIDRIARNRIYTVLDLSNAYLQLELHEKSRKFAVINTHLGLYCYNRLAFGIKTGPAKFQRVIDQIIHGIDNVAAYIDDIIIGGMSQEDCKRSTVLVLKRLQEFNVVVNYDKSKFFRTEIDYLGHNLSAEGVKPCQEKLKALKLAPSPKNVSEVRSYIGLINYYRKFIPRLSEKLINMQKLLEKNVKFKWTELEQAEFEKSKTLLSSSEAIAVFDPVRKTIVAADASQYGLGGVLSQIVNGEERIISCVSRTLNDVEERYPQIEKEALAIIFAIQKFHKYLFGKKFILCTDHEPLKTIFSPNKCIPRYALNRLQHYALILQSYEYDIQFKKGERNSNADGFSRLPLKLEEQHDDVVNVFTFNCIKPKLNLDNIADETKKDKLLGMVADLIKKGFPMKCANDELRLFFNKRFELHMVNECVFWNQRLVVPSGLRNAVLEILHEGHIGIVRTKRLARQEVWWPNIDVDIENCIKNCDTCTTFENKPNSNNELAEWPKATRPFQRVHVDFYNRYGYNFIIIVDAFSGWIDAKLMDDMIGSTVIDYFRELMATFGLISVIVSDNGSPFNGFEFKTFCEMNRIQHLFSPPYHPQSNGLAERGVQTIKNSLKKMVFDQQNFAEKQSIKQLLSNILFKYRNTPRGETDNTPAKLIMNYPILTDLRLLRVNDKIETENEELKEKSPFKIGQMVWVVRVQKIKDNMGNWERARVVKVVSERLIGVNCNGKTRVVHIGQIKESKRFKQKGE